MKSPLQDLQERDLFLIFDYINKYSDTAVLSDQGSFLWNELGRRVAVLERHLPDGMTILFRLIFAKSLERNRIQRRERRTGIYADHLPPYRPETVSACHTCASASRALPSPAPDRSVGKASAYLLCALFAEFVFGDKTAVSVFSRGKK